MRSKDIIEEVNGLYLQGLSIRQSADATGISKSVVGRIVKNSEIGRDTSTSQIFGCKRTTRLPFTWSFFPLTPEKAWLLGLIYGDGSLCIDGRKISITSGDYDVIDNINHLFGDNLGISSPTSTYQVITLHSGRIWKELNGNFALVPNKSRVLCYPELPDAMKSHFVRGLLDSDGCWKTDTRNPQPKLVFGFVSLTKEFVESLRVDFIRYVGVSPKRTVHEGSGFVLLYSNHDAVRIGHWIYADSNSRNRCERKFAYWSQFAR
jgi:hypothetical protein